MKYSKNRISLQRNINIERLILNLVIHQHLFVKKILLVLYFIIGNTGLAFAQPAMADNKKRDSLLAILQQARHDTGKVNQLFQLCLLVNRSNVPEELITYASESLVISQNHNYTRGIGISNYALGFYHYAKRNYEQALQAMEKAQQQFETCGDKESAGRCLYRKANILFDLGDYAGAINNFNKALQTWEATGFKQLTGICSNNLALAYARMGNYSKGVEYAYKAFKASDAMGDKKRWLSRFI